MSTSTEEIEVDLDAAAVEEAKKAADGGKKPPGDTLNEVVVAPEPKKEEKKVAAEVVTPDAGLEKLKNQLESERQARLKAENDAREARAAEAAAKGETQTTQLDLIKGAIERLTQSKGMIKAKYAAAAAASDWDAAADAQSEMADTAAQLQTLEQGKLSLEKQPKPQPRLADDPVERMAAQAQSGGYPKSAAWLRAHPDCVTDEKRNRKMIRAHEDALEDGLKADSDEYFQFIENRLGITMPKLNGNGAHKDDVEVDDPTAEAAKPVRKPPAAAPVSRSGTGTGTRSNVVTLSADQQEMARNMDMTNAEYAKYLMQIRKENEGKLN